MHVVHINSSEEDIDMQKKRPSATVAELCPVLGNERRNWLNKADFYFGIGGQEKGFQRPVDTLIKAILMLYLVPGSV